MIKCHRSDIVRNFIMIAGIIVFGVIILRHPHVASAGVKNGLNLLYENLIPSLFPFMILSGYIARSPATDYFAEFVNKLTKRFFYVNAYHIVAFVLGCTGGYPVGAKTIVEFKNKGYLSENEASRLFYWCINPGASFVITAVGTFMLGNTLSGVIIYISCIASSVVLGIFSSFFCKADTHKKEKYAPPKNSQHIFIKSVSSSVEAMLGICGWVLFFSTLCELCNQLVPNDGLKLFISSVAEVTSGCNATVSAGLSLPVLCAVISFGGLAVAAQISPDLLYCGVKPTAYLCWRVAGSAVSAFFCSQLVRLFPQCVTISATLTPAHALTKGIPTALIMVFMCIVLIFEVDNKRKVW